MRITPDKEDVERLTKKELPALLEFIKESYRVCDVEAFAQRVASRPSKVIPAEITSITFPDPLDQSSLCSHYGDPGKKSA